MIYCQQRHYSITNDYLMMDEGHHNGREAFRGARKGDFQLSSYKDYSRLSTSKAAQLTLEVLF